MDLGKAFDAVIAGSILICPYCNIIVPSDITVCQEQGEKLEYTTIRELSVCPCVTVSKQAI